MIRRLLYLIQDFFGISPKEARGALVLIVFSIAILWLPTLVRHWVLPFWAEPPQRPLQPMALDSIVAGLSASPAGAEETPEESNPRSSNEVSRPVRLFVFNPNEASTEQLQELGVPPFLARRIDNYRRKGGTFRKKQDLLRIYDFPEELYRRLEPYISLNETATASRPAEPAGPARIDRPAPTSIPPEVKANARPVVVPFDINTTDTTQLIRLRGIGSTLSLRIVRFRDALGGFHSPVQYNEVFGLDSLALSELNRYARIQSEVQKLPINSATADELGRHPYLRNKRQTEVIVRYREQHGPYQSAEDLKKVKVLDEKTILKIAPYLAF